ncbi:MAG: heme o synthase [Longimicrobiaceae bacterium]
MPDTVSKEEGWRAARRFGALGWIATGLVYLTIVVGGVVRITGSGLGCGDDWPLCGGHWIPPMTPETFIEYAHRLKALLVTGSVAALAGYGWRHRRKEPFRRLTAPAYLAAGLLAAQIGLGALTVMLHLPAWTTILHLLTSMLLLGAVLTAASRSPVSGPLPPVDGFVKLARAGAAGGLAVVALGAAVANTGSPPASPAPSAAAWACQGFPLCNGELLPAGDALVLLHWTHRLAAYLFVFLLLALLALAYRGGDSRRVRLAWAVAGTALAQGAVAGVMVLMELPDSLRVLHLALGGAVWGVAVLAAVLAGQSPARAPAPAPVVGAAGMTTATERAGAAAALRGRSGWGQRLRDYVTLTKPRIISLLLVTTVVPMVIAAGGWPGWGVVGWTVLAGYLMAGGANAVNMYLDRDLDARMGRTSLRPIPSGRMPPGHALAFGLALAAASFLLFAAGTNLLAATLALAGFLYYVFVYTRWLKRTSPQNIVIGGAAGAFPPLVGWAAASGSLSLTALVLFLIIFFWTPPHFWALALVKRGDYGRVGVPMAPNVWGERATVRRMLCYTLVLLPLTLLPVAYGELGLVYGASALLLGVWLLGGVIRLVGARGERAPAWAVYRTSLLYLALLFGAMAIDGVVPFGHGEGAPLPPAEAGK